MQGKRDSIVEISKRFSRMNKQTTKKDITKEFAKWIMENKSQEAISLRFLIALIFSSRRLHSRPWFFTICELFSRYFDSLLANNICAVICCLLNMKERDDVQWIENRYFSRDFDCMQIETTFCGCEESISQDGTFLDKIASSMTKCRPMENWFKDPQHWAQLSRRALRLCMMNVFHILLIFSIFHHFMSNEVWKP